MVYKIPVGSSYTAASCKASLSLANLVVYPSLHNGTLIMMRSISDLLTSVVLKGFLMGLWLSFGLVSLSDSQKLILKSSLQS